MNRYLICCCIVVFCAAGCGGNGSSGSGSAGSDRIVFVSDRSGNKDIFTMNVNVRNVKQLTNDAESDLGPQYRPDGQRIVYCRSSNVKGGDIYTMNSDGTNKVQITPSKPFIFNEWPSYSPDGKKIVFASDDNPDVLLHICTMNSDGSSVKQLTSSLSNQDRFPHFSPDGTKIVYETIKDNNNGTQTYQIIVMNADGTGGTQVGPDNCLQPTFSPDGSKIIYVQLVNNMGVIFTMSLDGSNQTQISPNGTDNFGPVYSPNGTKIVFGSDRDGNDELYEMNADGSNVRRLTIYNGEDQSPAWLP